MKQFITSRKTCRLSLHRTKEVIYAENFQRLASSWEEEQLNDLQVMTDYSRLRSDSNRNLSIGIEQDCKLLLINTVFRPLAYQE